MAVAGGVAGAWPAMAHEHAAEPVVRTWEAIVTEGSSRVQGAAAGGRPGERKTKLHKP